VGGVTVAVDWGVSDCVAVDCGVNDCVAVGVVDALRVGVAGGGLGLGETEANCVAVGVASGGTASSSAHPARTASRAAAVTHRAHGDAYRSVSCPFSTRNSP